MNARALSLALVITLCPGCATTQKNTLTPAEIERLKSGTLMTWTPAEQRLGYPNIEKLADTALVRRSARPSALRRAERDLSAFTYTHAGAAHTIDECMTSLNMVGLIAVRNGEILLERYRDGHDGDTAWTSFSVVKSLTSLLYGVAIKNGHITSLEEPLTRYLPELTSSAYEGVSLRQMLQMTSGVAWNSNLADKASDTYKLSDIDRNGGFDALLKFLAAKPRTSPPGTKFVYNTADADLSGAVLRRATGRTLAGYLTEHVWDPFGMEADGYWLRMRGSDLEHGDCCLSATLRDYARIGLFALNDGVTPRGVRLLPEGWMRESTRPSPAFPGYGYYWWLRKSGEFFASGSFGQHIEVDPATGIVVAVQSYWPSAYSDVLLSHNDALVAALIKTLR